MPFGRRAAEAVAAYLPDRARWRRSTGGADDPVQAELPWLRSNEPSLLVSSGSSREHSRDIPIYCLISAIYLQGFSPGRVENGGHQF